MARLIKYSGETVEVHPADGSNCFSLHELQRHVDGYIEIVRCRFPVRRGDNPLLLVNEEGRLHHLPINEDASHMAGVVLVGNVLHLTPKEWHATMQREDDVDV